MLQKQHLFTPKIRVVKRRVSANKKERRRTISINTAFTDLRDCIPNVPVDTKLSKIKTLKLATSYISWLMEVLQKNDARAIPADGFQTILTKTLESREDRRKREILKVSCDKISHWMFWLHSCSTIQSLITLFFFIEILTWDEYVERTVRM